MITRTQVQFTFVGYLRRGGGGEKRERERERERKRDEQSLLEQQQTLDTSPADFT